MATPGPSVLGAVVLVVLAGCAGSTATDSAQDLAVPNGNVRVLGFVVDSEHQPVPNATIRFRSLTGEPAMMNVSGDAAGQFLVDGLSPGTWQVRAGAPGYYERVSEAKVSGDVDELRLTIVLDARPVAVPFHISEPRATLHIQWGLAYHVGGDFNSGCLQPAYTCNAASYPGANRQFRALDPRETPFQTLVLEETWTTNLPLCAQSVAIDLYNPDAPSTNYPFFSNPHYWTNYPSTKWKTTNPIRMVIPREEAGNPEALNDPDRVSANGGPLYAKGNWTVRNFPPGRGITNQVVDVNCFLDQKLDIFFSTFYLEPAAADFTALKP